MHAKRDVEQTNLIKYSTTLGKRISAPAARTDSVAGNGWREMRSPPLSASISPICLIDVDADSYSKFAKFTAPDQ